MAFKQITDKAILQAIRDLTVHSSTTYEEVGQLVGMTKAGVYRRCKQFKEQGLVENNNVIRGLRLTRKGRKLL